jgi:pimeloyl-ACP methyl ester carboxylesterase
LSRATANGIELEYDLHGPADGPVVVLIMGLGMQLVAWPQALVDLLAARGLRVLRFDNRDAGLSTQFDQHRPARLSQAFMRVAFGLPIAAPYRLEDMAADTIGLLDTLGIARAHVVGASMGGMIAQTLAVRHPARVLTLTSIMSSSGARNLPPPRIDAFLALTRRPGRHASFEQLVAHYVHLFQVIGSPRYPTPEPELRERMRAVLARAYRPDGAARQLLAILASGSRARELPTITAPTLVIHGSADRLIPPAAGRDVAARVPGARLELIDGMGHDLPAALLPLLAKLIAVHCGQ